MNPFPPQTGIHSIQPGPMTHTGLLMGPQDPKESKKTLDLINDMCGNLTWKKKLSLVIEGLVTETGEYDGCLEIHDQFNFGFLH